MQDSTQSETAVLPESLLDSVSLLSKKWHPAIVRCLAANDDYGFSDLERRLDGISAKVLTDALDELQTYDIITRREISQRPLRVNYTLTQRGTELNDVIDSLAAWSETHLAEPDTEQVVLVADDDKRIRELHTDFLADDYTVREAGDGEATLRQLATDVGVVVLDRRMPGLSGGEVLEWIRSQRYDIRVVMVTSEDVDFDLIELDFDEYLTKPVRRAELRAAVATLFDRHEYSTQLQEYLALQSKLALLRVRYPDETLSANAEYQQLQARLSELAVSQRELEQVDDDILKRVPIGGVQ